MSHPVTCAKNADQCPGLIMLEGRQKQCTSEQKQADDVEAELERQEQVAAQEHGIRWLANIVEGADCQEKRLLTDPLKPRPKPHIMLKLPNDPSMELMNPEQDFNDGNGSLGEGPYLENNNGSQVDKVSDEDEASSQQHEVKLVHLSIFSCLTTMILLTETILFYWDCLDFSYHQHSQATAKDKFTGAADVKDWADKLTSKSLHMSLSQQSLSTNSHPPRTTPGTSTGSALKVPCSTPISSGTSHASHASHASCASLITCPASPDDIIAWSQPCDFYFDGPYIDGSDEVECNAVLKPFKQDI
ncbi:hypothetical protein F5141DRAFT_1211912 [Pisolithus sp. B1]|nr:hypothetical protein F5141DRAFT_1211912 [Pisolithus sp. B1]